MLLSIIIPAYNEAAYLGETLASLNRAKTLLERENDIQVEIVVVDNDSDDATADIARTCGATVAFAKQHNVAKVRNAGVGVSRGEVFVFVDADTVVPDQLLARIAKTMSDRTCIGGAVDTDYRPQKVAMRIYLQSWRVLGKLLGMAQGATQFCRRDSFVMLNGYDETLFMGEDVDFYWRLKKLARSQNARVVFIEDLSVVPSSRRFDQWPLWRILVWTNPLFILLFRRSESCWEGWYRAAPR
ncbi:MAG: glycosyltransferase [Pyrinomonadaceae bacterium]